MKRMTSSVISKCPATNRCPGTRSRKLGGMAADVIDMTVEIVGDYGDVLKRYDMKAGEQPAHRAEAGHGVDNHRRQLYDSAGTKKPE